MIMRRLMAFAAVAAAVLANLALPAPAAAAAKDSPWGPDYFPNVTLVTQDGKTVRFYEDLLKDKKVLINFSFSSCDQSCPLDTANMARVQKLLGDRIGRDIFMYSITLDPEHDTPKVLKEYAEKFGAGPGWLFLTGKREDIDAVRFKLGQRRAKEEHANTVQFGDVAKGRWMRLPLAADPNFIVTEVNNILDPGWSAGKTLKSIAEAPRLEVFGPGQLLFQNRCAGCHTFGKGAQLGPDLQGVTQRRERSWIMRYVAAPDQMRARKDPIALELAKKHKVLMPNLGLTKKELGELVDYLEAKNRPHPQREGTQAMEVAAAPGGEPPATLAHEQHHHDHHDHHHRADAAK